MPGNKECPFCGSENTAIDMFNGISGRPIWYRVQCQLCKSSTKWLEKREQAWAAWNARSPKPEPDPGEINTVINRNIFILHGLAYCRNPETGNCTAQKEFRGKAARIKEEAFKAAYRECETLCGKGKART
jgi:Lar family restriction alleviation protein